MSAIAASLIGAGVAAGGNIFSLYEQNRLNESYYNQFLSPVAQKRQMLAAGINPNAAAQGISGSFNPSFQSASASEAAGVSGEVGELLANSVNMEAVRRNTDADTDNVKTDTEGKKIENEWNQQTFQARIDELAKKNQWSDEDIKRMQAFNKYADDLYNWNSQKAKQDVENAKKQWELFKSEISKNEKLAELYDEQTGEVNQHKQKLYWETEYQKWFTNYCKDNNIMPGTPESEYLRNSLILADADPDSSEAKDAKQFVDTMDKCTEDIANDKAKGATVGAVQSTVENDPQAALKKRYYDMMEAELKPIEDQIKKWTAKRNKFQPGNPNYKQCDKEIRSLKRNYSRATNKWRRKMRHVDKGGSAGASAFGFGANVGT